jgi:hypothetical protein
VSGKNSTSLLLFLQLVEEANHVAGELGNRDLVLMREVSLRIPKLDPAELGFLRCVAFIYAHLYEASREGVQLLVEKLGAFGLDGSGNLKNFYILVPMIRTFLQHNLYPDSDNDADIQRTCKAWFHSACGTMIPETEQHWSDCLEQLLASACELVASIKDVTRRIELDESSEDIIQEWYFRRDRSFPPHEFDRLISEAAGDMGLDSIDPVRFRKRHLDIWKTKIRLLSIDCDPLLEARKVIEYSLLSDEIGIMPITGADIVQLLDVPPGPKVKAFLHRAKELYRSAPCPREDLLRQLRKWGEQEGLQ